MKQKLQQRKTRRGWETSTSWKMAIAGMVLATGMAQGVVAAAQGPSATVMTNSTDEPQGPQPGNTTIREFHIAAGPLTVATDAFHEATGLRVKFKVPAAELAGFHTAGVQGTYTDAAALHHLLEKTGLSFVFEGSNTVEIAVRSLESVDVTAATASVALQQFSQPLLDTAQSVNVIPQYILQEQAATGLRDSLRNAPGISIAAGEGGAQGDSLTIRGFSARNDIYLDGIRDFGSYYRDAFNYQSVDVLEGPASVEFGRGSTGGVVNQESKTPELRNALTGSAQLGTDLMRRGSLDFNHTIDALPGAAFRVNVVGEQTGYAERNVVETKRFGIAPSVAFELNSKTRASIAYLHEGESSIPDYGLPYFGAVVAPVDRSTYYGFAADNYLKTTPDILTGKVDHDFGTNVTVRNVLRWANYPRDVRITEPQVNMTGVPVYSNASGKTAYVDGNTTIGEKCDPTIANFTSPAGVTTIACYPTTTPLSQVQVKRNQLVSKSTEDILWDQMSATAHFNVGKIDNTGVVIVEGGRERSRPVRNSYTLPYTSLLNPNPGDAFTPQLQYSAVPTHVESQTFGIGFLDTVKVTRWLQASGGVRFDYFNTNSHNPANPAALPTATAAAVANRLDKQPTFRAAIVVKPRDNGSIYFDYGTSFNPSAESLSLSANNAVSPPEYNETFELGAKWSYLHDRLNLNGSLFRTEKLNARETDPNNSANTINAGNQLVRGLQIGVLGHMPSNFDLIVGYAYLDGRVENSIVNASPFAAINVLMVKANDPRANKGVYFISPAGFPLANVPKNSGNLWVTHRIKWRVTGGFGGSYVGARRASSTSLVALYNVAGVSDPANVPLAFRALPGYVMLNAMVKRPITEKIDLQVNVNNLTNNFFIDQPHPSHLVPGEGANAQFGLNYKF